MSASLLTRACVLLVLGLTACAPSQPVAPPPPAAGMAFDQLRLDHWQDVAIAPDGQRIAFVVYDGDDRYDVLMAEVGGTTRLLAVLHQEPIAPRWTADGSALVFLHEGRQSDGTLPMSPGFELYKLGLTGEPVKVSESADKPGKLTVGPNPDLLALRGTSFDARPSEPIRLFQPSTGLTKVASEKETWEPAFSPDGGAIAFFERDAEVEALVIFPWATGDRRVVPLGAGAAAFSELAWQPDGQGVTVYTGDRERQVKVRSFKLDGTAGPERRLELPATEAGTEVAYNVGSLSPDGKRMVATRQTAQLKREYRPDVIVDDPLAGQVLVDTETGAVLKTLDRKALVLGWLGGNRVLTQRMQLTWADGPVVDDGRLEVVTLP